MSTQPDWLKEPVFLVGAERSGTTLLRLMLDHHPAIAFNSEFEYAVTQIPETAEWPELELYYEWLENDRIFLGDEFVIDKSLSYPQLINSFLTQKRDHSNKTLVGATVHHHFDKLLRIWPDARFIHLIRDGRDVARSCIAMGWAGNVWTGVERWLEAEQRWENLEKCLSDDRKIDLKYEDLIKNPVETLTRLCEFIGVAYDRAMLSYAQTTSYDLPDAKLLIQWQKKLSSSEIQLIEARIAKMLQARGYELSQFPLLEVSRLKKLQLKWQDWLARGQFRLKRYGLTLFISDLLSRRLNLKQWQKQVQHQLNTVNTQYIK